MGIETTVKLNKFVPREYQKPVCNAIITEGGKYRKLLVVNPRRSGKDFMFWALMVREAARRPGLYMYCLPTFAQARSVIWEGKDNKGNSFLDVIPRQIIRKIRHDVMTINLVTETGHESIIRLVGSDSYNTSIVGSNPRFIVFSEYALCDENAFKLAALPIIRGNDGIVALIGTPRGKNHMYELYQIAKDNQEWFTQFLTIEDTGHISAEAVRQEIASGEISEDLAMQEYYCSFQLGAEGSYYAKYLDKMRLKGQIGNVPWEPYAKVHTAWDLGIKDPTCIVFFQVIGEIVRVIDYYQASDKPMDHFANIISNKPYVYGHHFPPHDIMQRESARGLTKREMYKELGIKFVEPVMVGIDDGIEVVRKTLSKIWIDENNCKQLIKALENYREEYDNKRKVYRGIPLHDQYSHACFVADTLILTSSGMRPIIDIKKNDQILTLSGWKKCNQATLMKKNAELVKVTFKDGTTVKCTPEHLFLTEKGWKSAKYLTPNTVILSSSMKKQFNGTEKHTNYEKENDISIELMAKDYIVKCGNLLLEKFQQVVTYITKTVTQKIMFYPILNVYQQPSIYHYQLTEKILSAKNVEMLLLNGTDQKKVENGTVFTHKKPKIGKNGIGKLENVFFVKKILTALLEKIHRSFATQIVEHPIVESVSSLNEKQDVYCINVPDFHHFSLSNGAIVHNSDAFRYMCISLPKTRDGLSAEKIEKNYREAIMGDQANLPPVFRDTQYY